MMRVVIALEFAVQLTACSSEPSTPLVEAEPTTRGEIIDYAGRVCGDQSLHAFSLE